MTDSTTQILNINPDGWDELRKTWSELVQVEESAAAILKQYEAGIFGGKDPAAFHTEILAQAAKILREAKISPRVGLEKDTSMGELLAQYWQEVARRQNVAVTPFDRLNTALGGGLEPGRLVGVLGAPNCGKTTFCHQLAEEVAFKGRPVLYVTSEDTPAALLAKTLARIGTVPYTDVLKGNPQYSQKINTALSNAAKRPSSSRLRYLDAISGADQLYIRQTAEKHFERFKNAENGGPGVIVIDYLQRYARALGLTDDLRQAVTKATEWAKAISVELDCTVIVISAMNRTSYNVKGSSMAAAKESGDIEYSCDVMMTLTSDDIDATGDELAVKLTVEKNRQGRRGQTIDFEFTPDYQKFKEDK